MRYPPRLLPPGLFIASLLIFLVPASAEQCIVGCHGMSATKSYKEGHTYVYDFEGKSRTSVPNAEDGSEIKLDAVVELAVKPDCIHQLKLKNVRVNGAAVTQDDVEKHALQFNYHDGHIDTSVCAEPGDSQTSLNIKRAIVSLFQSAMVQESGSTTHRETDIFGTCQTDFEFHKKGDIVTINKIRNLAHCSHRESMRHALINPIYDDSSNIKSSPILDSRQDVEMILKNGILNSAKSTEHYRYRPFSNGEIGAETRVESKLTLKSDQPSAGPNAAVSLPKSLVFDPPHPVVDSSSSKAIEQALQSVKSHSKPEITSDKAAEDFGRLVKVLRRSNKKDMMDVYNRVKGDNASKKILLDALYRTGSGEAAEVIVDLIKNKEVTGLQVLAFYASLALVDHVTLPAVTAVASLIDQPDLPRIGYLGIGRVIGKYCQDHGCEDTAPVKAALEKLVSKIGNGKPGSRNQENLVIAALKGIRNSKYLDDQTIDKIVSITKDKSVHDRVRVAAIEVFPAKCSMKWKKPTIELFGDKEEDSEIRIKAYLSLVACACPHVAKSIKEIIDVETVNQVGSFVTSHLRNLRASTDPSKHYAKGHLGEIHVNKKFPEDCRKFSFNREFSYNIDSLGIGSSAEHNVIYSQKSFVPRSVSLNLTSEVFGRSFNFLEVDARAENLDRLIEHYFGPKGVLKRQALAAVLTDGKQGASEFYEHLRERIQKSSRGRRSAIKHTDLERFAQSAKPKESEVDDDLDIDLSVKLFGVELAYVDWKEGSAMNPNFIIDRVFDMIDHASKKAKDFDYSTTNHMHFMDIDLIYPMGLGFPMTVGVEGNGVTHVNANGKLDIPAMLRDPNNAVIKIGVEPSANIAIAATWGIESFGTESGMKIISRMHTSTGSSLAIKVLDGKGIDVSFGIPKRKQEIISMSTQVLFKEKGQSKEMKVPKGKEQSYCFDQLSDIMGVTVCGLVVYPYDSIEAARNKPLYPLSGPSKLSIILENNDVTTYHFRAFYDLTKPQEASAELSLDTPNSRTNRKLGFKLDGVNKPNEKYVRATLESPIKKLIGEIRFENNDKKKAFTMTLTHDSDEYYGSIGLVSNGNKYKPILEYKVPEHIERLAGGKGTKGGSKSSYKLDGDITVSDQDGGKKYTFEKVTMIASGKPLVSIDGLVMVKPDAIIIDGKVSHNDENLSVSLDGKRKPQGFDLILAVIPSKDLNVGFKTLWHCEVSDGLIDHNLIFIHGADLESNTNRLTISDHITYKKNDHPATPYEYFQSFESKSKLTYPARELAAKFDVEISRHSFETEVDLKYGKFKTGTELEIKVEEGSPQNWEFGFEAHVLESKVAVEAKHKKVSDHKRKFEGKLEIPGGKYELETAANYHVEGPNADVQLNGNLKVNGKSLAMDYGLQSNPQKLDNHAFVSLENVKYLDYTLHIQRGNNPEGNLNLNLKNLLLVTGQFNYQNGKGSGNVVMDIPKLNRKIKGTGDVTVTGTRHAGNLEILFDAEKDPSKKIKVTTDSDIQKGSIDSKNTIEILSYKIEANAKGNFKETKQNGYHFEGEADVLLPNGHYLVGKGKQKIDRTPGHADATGDYSFIFSKKKGGESRSINYNFKGEFSEPKHQNFKGHHKLKLVDFDGKDIQLVIGTGHATAENSNKRAGFIQVLASGSALPKEFGFDLQFDHTNKDDFSVPREMSWTLTSAFGNDFSVKGSSKYFDGFPVKKPRTGSLDIALTLPSEKLRNLKYQGSGSLVSPKGFGDEFDYTASHSLIYNDDKTVKADVHLHQNGFEPNKKKDGSGKITMTILSHPPLTIGTAFSHDPTGEMKKGTGKLNVNYGEKEITAEVDASYKLDLTNIEVNVKATTPVEKYRTVQFGFIHKKEKEGLWKYEVHLGADGSKYELVSEFEMSPGVHRTNVIFSCPNGKTELLAKVNKISDTEYKGEWKIDSPKGFATADGHVKMDSVDNFIIKVNFDSDKITYRKISAEITTTPAVKTGKRIILTVTSDGKNIITGSTNYSKRDEAGKIIVEGNGSLKIGENTSSSKFTYSRKQLTHENDGETGVAILLNANFGPFAVVGELKLSDKEVLVFNSYCEQSKDCALFKLQSTINTDHKTRLDHQIAVQVDLNKFKVPVEFGLMTTTKYHPKEPSFDHTANLYLHTSKDKTEYSTHIYCHQKESAVILTLPSRELALIASIDVPKSKTPIGPYKIDISAYLDRKNHPNVKTSFVANGDINVEKNAGTIDGEARFIYPSETKALVVKGKLHYGGDHLLDANVDIDVFAKKTQKIAIIMHLAKNNLPKGYNVTADLEVNSKGQQLKVNLKQHFALSPSEIGFGSFLSYTDQQQKPKTVGGLFSLNANQIHVLVQAPNKDLFRSDSTLDISKNSQKIETEWVLLDNSPVIMKFEAQNLNSFNYQSYAKNKPDTKLIVNGRAIFGQVAEIHADAIRDGQKKNLFSVGLYLDEGRFLKPNFVYNKENMGNMIDFYRDLSTKRVEQLREVMKLIGNEIVTEFTDLFEHLKKSQPNYKPVLDYYQAELKKLREELNADTTIKEIHATLNKIFGGLIAAITKTLSQLTERMAELNKQFHEIIEKFSEAFKAIVPRLKESYEKILHAATEVLDAAVRLGATYIKVFFDIINQHHKEIKELVAAISALLHDFVEVANKGLIQVQREVDNFIKLTVQQIQALPIYEFIKEKFTELSKYQVPDTILMPIEEAFIQLKKILPTEALREFVTVTYNYIIKHIKHQKIDDITELTNIYTHAIDAIQSIIELLQNHGIINKLYGLLGMRIQGDLGFLKNLPGFPMMKLSLWNVIKSHELPTVLDMYYAYRPTLIVSDIIPPFTKMGIVVEGGHFFTFDGRHLTMAGSCDYVLAQDTRDGNFSVVGTFNNGKLISITVTAPGESITLKSNGNILADNKPAEYPVSTKNLHAFLTLPIVNVKSDYGVHVACSQKAPMICSVLVSGFYHGKLRGIFGDGNNEPYDDFTLPSGHVTENESEFGNAYKLDPACAAAPAVDHHSHDRNPTCTEYFSSSSSLSSCFNYVNPTTYRQACDHAMSAGTPRAACLISAAYYAACRKERIFVSIPAACSKCQNGKDEIAVGDAFSVKIPKKEADIVFVVEQDVKNKNIFKDLIMPLISELKSELSHHGVTDVHVGLIGFGEHMKWPQHYTTGGNINIDKEVKNMNFVAGSPQITFKEAKDGDTKTRLKYAEQRLNVEFGTFKLTDAYEEAIHYPFRVGAAKAVVGVIANPCEKSALPLSLQHLRLFLGQKVYRDLGLSYYHVGYLNDILVNGKPQKNVVGYDAKHGYTFSDSKKTPLVGSIDKNNLILTSNDVCAGFAVSSGGAAFSSNHFLESKQQQKKFLQVTARRLADGLINTEIEEDCVCKQHHGLAGQANCKIVGRKELTARHTKGGVKG